MNRIRWSSFGRKLIGVAVAATATLVVAGSVSAAAGASQSLLLQSSFAHVTPPAGFLSLFSGSVGTAAGFEDDDANLAPEGATDWNSFSPTSWTGTAPYQQSTKVSAPWTFYGASDATDTRTDSGFAGGTKEDKVCPSVIGSNTPNKDDLARIYLAGEHVGSHVYLMLAWVRIPQASTSSDEHVAFEFNQGTTSCGGGSPLVQRTEGDLLVIYDFTSGGTPTFSLSKWVASGSCEVGSDSAPCWGPQETITAAEGAVNTSGDVSDTISPSSPIAATLGTSEFGEAGIDLTSATVGLAGGRACERFGTASAVSRSSGSSSTAEMEDLVGPISVDLSNCVTPGISTTPSPSSGALGTHLNDTAQLSGGNNPTGSITFNLYGPADSTCAGTPLYTETDPVSSNSAATTGGPAAASAGTYHWTATYGGDGNNNPASSACADEAVTIAKASPAIGTTPSPTGGALGTALNDTAQVSGGSNPSGTVSFSLYGPADLSCSGTPLFIQTDNLSGGNAATTGGPAAASAGTYHWTATYNGDGNNNTASSACTDEAVTIAKASPTIATTLSSSSVTAGDTVHDSAALTGATSTAGGTVAYTVYTNDTCSAGARSAGTKGVTNGVVTDSDGLAFASAGTFYWQAVYSGDTNNDGATSVCQSEILTVGKVTPTIATTLSATTGAIGDTVHDSATLSGATSNAGGTVTYTVYTNDACSAGARSAGTKGVTNGVVTDSNGLLFSSAGTFYWQAVYSGDVNNNGATSPCQSEILTVGKNSPTISTTLSTSDASIGESVHDSATLSGATADAGGTVTYTAYTNDTCTDGARTAGTKAVTSGVVTDSDGLTFSAAGTAYWQAVYSGDANNNGATSPCRSEILTIAKNSPTISTTLSAGEVVIGSGVHDSAALNGATAGAGGTVTYTVYSDNECSSGARDAGTKAVTSGVVTDSDSLTFPTAGTFYWRAVYSGDANNDGATSPCSEEQLTVDRPAITITKNPKSQSVDSGGTASFTITVTNTGTVALTNVAVTDDLAPNCAKAVGALAPGQSTSYSCTLAGVTSAFTNSATATGHPPVGPDVTATDTAPVTVNATPPPPSTPPAPPAPKIDLAIVKTATPSSSALGDRVTWTLTIKNNGPSGATGVTVADPIPAGMRYVSSTTTQGTCTGGAMLSCQLGSMASGASVTITLVTTSSATGTITNTATVVGNEAETNTANNTATAQTQVKGPFVPPAIVCTAVGVAPKQLLVGHKSLLKMRVSRKGVPVKGIRVRIHGSTLSIVTARSNGKGLVTRTVRPLRPGIVVFRPVAQKGCQVTRIGVIGVFTPPVTG